MAYGRMSRMACGIIVIALTLQYGYTRAGPTSSRNRSYLPPLPPASHQPDSVHQGSSIVETKQLSAYPSAYTATTYSTNHLAPDIFQTNPQLSNHKSVSSYTRTYYNSYAPQPSGVGKHLPQPPTPAPLPSLIPKSVLDQFTSTSPARFPSTRGKSIASSLSVQSSKRSTTSSVLDSLPSSPSSLSSGSGYVNSVDGRAHHHQSNHPSQSYIMFDTPPSVLTPSQNETIYAAKLLASSLLQATGEGPIEKLDGFNIVDTNNIKENDLNSTDVVIVKSQKNAYIIPTKLPTGENAPAAIDDLYNMRDKLNKAYTINQFIFIIKPERINFLNKLV